MLFGSDLRIIHVQKDPTNQKNLTQSGTVLDTCGIATRILVFLKQSNVERYKIRITSKGAHQNNITFLVLSGVVIVRKIELRRKFKNRIFIVYALVYLIIK